MTDIGLRVFGGSVGRPKLPQSFLVVEPSAYRIDPNGSSQGEPGLLPQSVGIESRIRQRVGSISSSGDYSRNGHPVLCSG
jgi:hypothetical protein